MNATESADVTTTGQLLDVRLAAIPYESVLFNVPDGADRSAWGKAIVEWLAGHGIESSWSNNDYGLLSVGRHLFVAGYGYTLGVYAGRLEWFGSTEFVPAGVDGDDDELGWCGPTVVPAAAVAVDGVTSWQRSDSSDCICCEGPHVFGYGIDTDTGTHPADLINRAARTFPEGTRVRVSVIALPVKTARA